MEGIKEKSNVRLRLYDEEGHYQPSTHWETNKSSKRARRMKLRDVGEEL